MSSWSCPLAINRHDTAPLGNGQPEVRRSVTSRTSSTTLMISQRLKITVTVNLRHLIVGVCVCVCVCVCVWQIGTNCMIGIRDFMVLCFQSS